LSDCDSETTHACWTDLSGAGLDRDFRGFAQALDGNEDGRELLVTLFPFTEGKFAKLFTSRPDTKPREGVHAVCYDFLHLMDPLSLLCRLATSVPP